MPSLRISFPEKESPSVVVLRGKRVTIGRLPENAIQIRDRTISGYHAELIEEEGHYRLHDLGSTNGVLVNGEPVTDFHLEEACKVTFGGVECEFSPESPAEAEIDPALALMTHGQSEALLSKNTELEKTVASLREQVAEFQKTAGGGESEGATELQRLVGKVTTLEDSLAARDRKIQQLETDLSVMHRDRANLQRALNEAKAEPTAEAKPEPASEPAPVPAPVAPAEPIVPAEPVVAPTAEAAPQPPAPTARPAAVPIPTPVPAPAPAPAPAANVPLAKPVIAPSKPALPKPKAPLPHATPAAPSAPGVGAGAAAARPIAKPVPKPIGRPQPGAASNGNGTPTGNPRPASFTKSPAGSANPQATPTPSLATRPPTAVSGPKGTQKIDT